MAINFRTYTNDFSDSKYKEIDDIRGAKEGSDNLFELEERCLFDDWGINNIDKAKELGNLILMVKKAELTRTEDKELWQKIEIEKTKEKENKPSLAYQILNAADERVDAAASRLARFFKSKDLPKTKEERQTKIKDLEKQKFEQVKKKLI